MNLKKFLLTTVAISSITFGIEENVIAMMPTKDLYRNYGDEQSASRGMSYQYCYLKGQEQALYRYVKKIEPYNISPNLITIEANGDDFYCNIFIPLLRANILVQQAGEVTFDQAKRIVMDYFTEEDMSERAIMQLSRPCNHEELVIASSLFNFMNTGDINTLQIICCNKEDLQRFSPSQKVVLSPFLNYHFRKCYLENAIDCFRASVRESFSPNWIIRQHDSDQTAESIAKCLLSEDLGDEISDDNKKYIAPTNVLLYRLQWLAKLPKSDFFFKKFFSDNLLCRIPQPTWGYPPTKKLLSDFSDFYHLNIPGRLHYVVSELSKKIAFVKRSAGEAKEKAKDGLRHFLEEHKELLYKLPEGYDSSSDIDKFVNGIFDGYCFIREDFDSKFQETIIKDLKGDFSRRVLEVDKELMKDDLSPIEEMYSGMFWWYYNENINPDIIIMRQNIDDIHYLQSELLPRALFMNFINRYILLDKESATPQEQKTLNRFFFSDEVIDRALAKAPHVSDQIQDGEIIINEVIMQIDQAKMLMSGDYEELADAEVEGSEFVLTKELSTAEKKASEW